MPQEDGADRVSGVTKSPLSASAAFSGIAVLLLVGLLLRLAIAYVFLPGSGFESDIGTFTAWSLDLAERGAGSFYATAGFADYPPGYLYVLWLIGGLGHVLAPLAHGDPAAATTALIKLPAIFADVLVGFVIYRLVRAWRAPRVDAQNLALLAAAIYLFNPVSWYDSAVWGQTDAIGALVALLTIAALVRGNSEGATALAVLAALIKPQFGILLIPIVGIVLLRRHLLKPGSGPENAILAPAPVRSWFKSERGVWRLVSSAVVGLAVMLLLITPFSLDFFGFFRQMTETAQGYKYLSVNAYNPWALFATDGAQPLAFGGGWSYDLVDTQGRVIPFLGPIPAVFIGGALLLAGFLVGIFRLGWRDDRRSIIVVTIFLALGFFMLPTRVHERYMFPIFGLLPLLAVVDRRWLWATVALSIAAFINFHGILTTPLYATPNLEKLPLGDAFREPVGIVLAILLHIAGFAWVIWQMRRSAVKEPDPYEAAVVTRRASVAPATAGARPVRRGMADVPAGAAGAAATLAATARSAEPEAAELTPTPEIYVEPAPPMFAGVREAFGRIVRMPSIRRDRSALLVGETGGPLDRRDLGLIALVFISTLLLRTYRLEVPYSMHFDEVYHARTAMEFLQDWQYDMPHDIYEYTHPHLAKYAMALGIMAMGNNHVTNVQQLPAGAVDAALERRWAPQDNINARNGDRLYVVEDSGVRVLDLATRQTVASIPGVYDSAAIDPTSHTLFLSSADGTITKVDTNYFDGLRQTNSTDDQVVAQPFATVAVTDDLSTLTVASNFLVAVTGGGDVINLDLASGAETARTFYPDPTTVLAVTARARVFVDPALVIDTAALAEELGGLLDRDSFAIQSDIETATAPIPIAGFLSKKTLEDLQEKIDAEALPGVTVEDGTGIAIGLSTGIVLLDADSLNELAFFGTTEPVTGMALVESGLEQPTIFAATGDTLSTLELPNDDAARMGGDVEMPNTVEQVYWNKATTMVHVLGRAQAASTPTIYVVEPRSKSVFADAPLASEPEAIVIDDLKERPAEDRNDLLAIDASGQIATVDTGNNQFAYRFPGVVLGSLTAVCIYLLARFLFRRRSVALIAALLVLFDGMFFANARIAMNDTYVAFFIVAAFAVFVPLWLGRWRRSWQIVVGMAAVGLLLGLALSSKWVGAYAIGGVGLLILLRSALGRVIALLGMIAMTAVLGYIAITPNPSVVSPQLNFPFLALMLGLTALLAIAMAVRPVRMTREELRFAVLAPLIPGALITAYALFRLVAGPPVVIGQSLTPTRLLMIGGVLVALGIGSFVVAWLAGRYGRGPLARLDRIDPDRVPSEPPPPRGWLRPGSGLLGLPWVLSLAAISVIPLAVYVIHYAPWIALGNQWFTGNPAGNTGQTLIALQQSMYDYHNFLRATHPASSPWWAWPFDLKPVWFEQNDYVGSTTAVIYDTGNLVIFWLAIPAVLWMAWKAWQRRSLPLTVLAIAIASMWLPWARIDRATFQYHIFTTLPFSFLALAYFLGEMWHGPSPRTWALARVSAAVAILGAPLLWLLRLPLCGIARTEQVNEGTEVCAALSRELTLTDLQFIGLVVAIGGLIAAGILYWRFRAEGGPIGNQALLLPVSFSAALLGVAIVVIGAGVGGRELFAVNVQAEWPALGALLLLAIPAYFVLRATDPRRFVISAVAAAGIWFVAFYPNIASLPVPTALSQIHLGLLPTWNWGFQFGVNMDDPNRAGLDYPAVGLLALAVVVLCVAAVYAAKSWRSRPTVSESEISGLPEAG
jgi:hypothetical protein